MTQLSPPPAPISPLRLLPAAALLQLSRLAIWSGLRPRRDGWRYASGLVLRNPRSAFALSAFGLDPWSDARPAQSPSPAATRDHVSQRLKAALAREKPLHIRIIRDPLMDRHEACEGAAYTLAFQDWRIGSDRFCPPQDWYGPNSPNDPQHAGALFNFVCRVGPQHQVDVWVRINHVGTDGVPAQEVLTRLESEWGAAEQVIYPDDTTFEPRCDPVPETDIAQVQAFLDFTPLLAWRKEQNARLPEPMTISAALIWCLTRHPAFAELHVGTTVEMDPFRTLSRGVGLVVIKPADYFSQSNGLASYVREFNRQLSLIRPRNSPSSRILDALVSLPPTLARTILRHGLDNDPRAFGTLALSIIKDAKVFGAPLAEFGHARGFIALGSISLPTADGRRVGCITVKGRAETIARYPALIAEAVRSLASTPTLTVPAMP